VPKIDERLEKTAVGGLDIQTIGLVWLVLGVVIASIVRLAAVLACQLPSVQRRS
jgi:hypothetical protein